MSMITDADIKKLKTVFATKDDLKIYATKQELSFEIAPLRHDIRRLDAKIDVLDEKFNDFRGILDQILNSLDSKAQITLDLQVEYAALKGSDIRQTQQIKEVAKHVGYTLKDSF